MTPDELRTMSHSGLLEIGSHTCHRYRLKSELSEKGMRREIVENKSRLEEIVDKRVDLFC